MILFLERGQNREQVYEAFDQLLEENFRNGEFGNNLQTRARVLDELASISALSGADQSRVLDVYRQERDGLQSTSYDDRCELGAWLTLSRLYE